MCRVLALPADAFLDVWWSLAVTSVVGLLLAYFETFSLIALVALVTALSACLLAIAIAFGRRRATLESPGPLANALRLAPLAALVMAAWCWPPFETIIGASDSTMYVSAGIHLARDGKLTVTDTMIPLLPPDLPAAIFPSVALAGSGPYIRLPGGLLMPTLHGGETTPAFFPLPSVWTAIFAAVGGETAAPAVAPIFAGLASWAVTVLAAELVGGFGAFLCAVLLIANYAVWWFGRFPMAEIIALTFLWGGFGALARGARGPALTARNDGNRHARAYAFSAGVLVGMAGLARTETFLFVAAAASLFVVWQRARMRAGSFVLGFVLPFVVAAMTIATAPSHHAAYLVNDVTVAASTSLAGLAKLRASPWFRLVLAAPVLLAIAAGVLGRWRGVGFFRGAARALVPLPIAAAIVIYARIGGEARPLQHAGWIAGYCSWPLLAVAMVGAVMLWRRGGGVARLLLTLVAIVAVVFIINPRVAPYQPWAIRRFLPVVIPAIALAAATALATLQRLHRYGTVAAVVVTLVFAVIEIRPVLAMRRKPLFADGFATVGSFADLFPEDAFVVMDSSFSDLQLQVPLWLAHGRETVMVRGGSPRWRDTVAALVASGRPTYWVANQNATAPSAPDLTFSPIDDRDITVIVPAGSVDTPPTEAVRYLTQLRVYAARRAQTD